MNDNRKLSLCLVSVLGIVTTAMTFLYPQDSPFWIASQLMLLLGMVLFLGMALFVWDARNFKLFAIPVSILVLGELFSVFLQFRFQLDANGMRMESLTTNGHFVDVLGAVVGVLQFVILAWAIIDISTDFSFCHLTCPALTVCCGISVVINLILFSFALRDSFDMIRMYSVACLSDCFTFGTVVVFYFTYTKERRVLYHYYKALAAEQKKTAVAETK